MPGIVMTFPIVAGKVEAWRRFCQEMSGSRSITYEASRRRLGITSERLALVDTPFGSAAVTTVESLDIVRTLTGIITSALPFDRWYRERVEELSGVNLTRYEQFAQPAPATQPQELLFEWTLLSGPGSLKSRPAHGPAMGPSIREIKGITP
jgi:hypothetical protein